MAAFLPGGPTLCHDRDGPLCPWYENRNVLHVYFGFFDSGHISPTRPVLPFLFRIGPLNFIIVQARAGLKAPQ
jgi:hypothetical protein